MREIARMNHGVLDRKSSAGARWWIIEQDNPVEPIADALRAIRNMESLSRES